MWAAVRLNDTPFDYVRVVEGIWQGPNKPHGLPKLFVRFCAISQDSIWQYPGPRRL